MLELAAIPLGAFLYRLRGAGWKWDPPRSFGVPESKTVGLFLLALLMAAPVLRDLSPPAFLVTQFDFEAIIIGLAIPTPHRWLAISIAVGLTIWLGRAGHGTVYHDGMMAPPRPRQSNGWLAWIPGQVGQEASVWKDRTGLAYTGVLLIVSTALAAVLSGATPYAIILIAAGLLGKPLAYALGWRVTGGKTEHGEWLFGAFIGLAVWMGLVL